jgi:hypothetical protein
MTMEHALWIGFCVLRSGQSNRAYDTIVPKNWTGPKGVALYGLKGVLKAEGLPG